MSLIARLNRSRRAFQAGLALVAVTFLVTVAFSVSLDSFGFYHDDALYFASARSLALGDGYLAPSLPGAPPQTKYPILYPLALSVVWRLSPDYPANLVWAYALNAAFGLALVLAAAVVLRQLGAGRAAALGLTAAFAFHPHTLYWTSALLSEALFGALVLSGLAAGSRALPDRRSRWGLWMLAVVLLGAASATRTIGVACVGGLAAWALGRRRFAAAAVAFLAAAPCLAEFVRSAGGPPSDGPAPLARTLAYYTSYGRFWRLSVPDLETFLAQTSYLLAETMQYPAVAVFGAPAGSAAPSLVQMAAVALAAGILRGVATGVRRGGLHPIHCAALCYLPVTLLWNYPLLTRFWLPFLPLLLAGAAVELGVLARAIERAWRAGARGVPAGFAAALVMLIAFAAWRHVADTPAAFARRSRERAALTQEKREAYEWLRLRRMPVIPEPVISYEDPLVYLATGLPAIRPAVFTTGWFYRQDAAGLERELEALGEIAVAVRARYWMVADDDFQSETAPEQARAAQRERLRDEKAAFVSSAGRVRVYELAAGVPRRVSQGRSRD